MLLFQQSILRTKIDKFLLLQKKGVGKGRANVPEVLKTILMKVMNRRATEVKRKK